MKYHFLKDAYSIHPEIPIKSTRYSLSREHRLGRTQLSMCCAYLGVECVLGGGGQEGFSVCSVSSYREVSGGRHTQKMETKDSESDLEEGRWSQPQKTQACDVKMARLVGVLAMPLELYPRNSHRVEGKPSARPSLIPRCTPWHSQAPTHRQTVERRKALCSTCLLPPFLSPTNPGSLEKLFKRVKGKPTTVFSTSLHS